MAAQTQPAAPASDAAAKDKELADLKAEVSQLRTQAAEHAAQQVQLEPMVSTLPTPQAPQVDIAHIVAQSLMAANTLRTTRPPATAGLDEVPAGTAAMYGVNGQVVDPEGRILPNAPAAVKREVQNAYLRSRGQRVPGDDESL